MLDTIDVPRWLERFSLEESCELADASWPGDAVPQTANPETAPGQHGLFISVPADTPDTRFQAVSARVLAASCARQESNLRANGHLLLVEGLTGGLTPSHVPAIGVETAGLWIRLCVSGLSGVDLVEVLDPH